MLDARLTYVLAVSREGSFTAAARAIGVTQPAVTKSIADLERQVGYAIFYRTPGGAIPTENGRTFIARAGRIVEDTRELLSKPAGEDDPYAGVLRIGIEAAGAFGWDRWLGPEGIFIGMPGFGASANYEDLYKHFGITAERITKKVQDVISRRREGA